MPDSSNMCINVMTAPWSRVRHWSAPERLEWTVTEKAEAAESATATTLKPTLNRSASEATLGCRNIDDLGLITMRSSLGGSSPPAYDNCNDDKFFSDFFPLDCRDDDLTDDPFADDPPPAVDDARPMTSDEMGQSLLRFWSFKMSSDDLRQSSVASAECKSAYEVARSSCVKDNYCSCGERLESQQHHHHQQHHRCCDADLKNAGTHLKDSCVSSDDLITTRREAVVEEQREHIAATAFTVPETMTKSSGAIRQPTQLDSLPPEPDLGRAGSQHRSPLSWISTSITSSVSQFCETLQLQRRNLKSCTGPTSHNTALTLTSPASSSASSSSSASKKTRRRKKVSIWSCTTSLHWLFITSLLMISTPTMAKICPTTIIYDISLMEGLLRNCTVIEGHFAFTNMFQKDANSTPVIPSFPELREITDFMLLYLGEQLKTLATVFPNLSVIRGNKLMKDYALVIREMKGMEEIGLTGLTHILRGAVKIEKNSDLCYVDTVDWKAIIPDEKYRKLISIDQNEFSNKNCMNKCPAACGDNNNCWNERSCQTIIVPCPHGSHDNRICYRNGTSVNGQLMSCDKECLGGCSGPTQDHCFACLNAKILDTNGGCRSQCPEPTLLYDRWRCITAAECSKMSYTYNAEEINLRKSYKAYNGECLAGCPEETKENQTKEGIWICEKCENCPLECQGATISSLEDLYRFKGCTIITGDLTIQVRGENVVEELHRHLGRVRTITGSLKIARSFPIVSLDFFQNLEEIQGIRIVDTRQDKKHYSITIMENENLQKLFPTRPNGKNVRIWTRNGKEGQSNPGRAFIHYNPKLCPQEIKDLLVKSGLEKPEENSAEISYATNGDKAVCSSNKLNVTVSFQDKGVFPSGARTEVTQLEMTVQFNNYQAAITSKDPTSNTRALLGYEIHYREIDKATYDAKNMTKYGGRDACGDDDWLIIDHPPADQERDKNTRVPVWPDEVELVWVRPYTYYAIFVTTLIVKEVSGSHNIDGAQSDIVYVLSPEDFPSVPHELKFSKFNYSAINVTWSAPEAPNGIVDHYELILELKELNLAKLRGVQYCDTDYQKQHQKPKTEKKEDQTAEATPTNATKQDCPCDCRTCGKPKKSDFNAKAEKFLDESLIDSIIDTIFPQNTPPLPPPESLRAKRSTQKFGAALPETAYAYQDFEMEFKNRWRRSISNSGDNKIEKSTADGDSEKAESSRKIVEVSDSDERRNGTSPNSGPSRRPYSKKMLGDEYRDTVYVLYSAQIPGNVQHTVVNNLQHDTTYTVKLRACHRPGVTGVKRCSDFVTDEVKTMVRPNADDIPGELRAYQDSKGDNQNNETNSIAYIEWDPPTNPNTMIVRYNVRITKVDENFQVINCITARQFEDDQRKYIMKLPGTYYVEVQAVPLNAEPGQWTKPVKVSVAVEDRTQFLLAVLIPVFVVLVITGICGVCFWIRAKKEPPPLIPNDTYHLVENVFSRDEYWIERDNVEVGERIGSGAFGEVHEGLYHHPNHGQVRVAIKMLRENANWLDRKLFLEEANIMKNLRSAHIVELIGAVPNGFPYYILLEMMPNGDLKKFLRDSRPHELNRQAVRDPPSERTLLQMALEIADGMAYLSSRPRSIVHRDLAARNCLLTADNVVKVGDFGRARDVYESEYYRQTFRGMVPVRWMPPESLRDGEYVSKSDVWSYGVVMWEMATLAEEPYQGMRHDEVVHYIINDGGKPEIRPTFSDTMKEVMLMCWKRYPDDRPSFIEICRHLERFANERFRNTAFMYTEEGRELSVLNEDGGEISEKAPLRGSSSSGYGNGNTGNSNGDARSASTIDNGHAVMAASELGSIQGEVRPLGSGSVSFRNPSSSSNNLNNIRNFLLRIRHGGGVALRGNGTQRDSSAEA